MSGLEDAVSISAGRVRGGLTASAASGRSAATRTRMTGVLLRFWTGTVNHASSGLDGSFTLRADSDGPRSSSASGAARLSAVVVASVDGVTDSSVAANAVITQASHT